MAQPGSAPVWKRAHFGVVGVGVGSVIVGEFALGPVYTVGVNKVV